jgi:hypothetical protein
MMCFTWLHNFVSLYTLARHSSLYWFLIINTATELYHYYNFRVITLLLLPGYNISRTCGLLVNFRIIELLLFCFYFTFLFVPFPFRIRMTSLSQRFLLKTLYKNNGHIHTEQLIVQNIRYINETNTNTEIKP